jgi:hypothetical protein
MNTYLFFLSRERATAVASPPIPPEGGFSGIPFEGAGRFRRLLKELPGQAAIEEAKTASNGV